MIQGLNYAIKSLERAIKRHKYYASGNYSKANKSVKFSHFCQAQALSNAITLLKKKRSQLKSTNTITCRINKNHMTQFEKMDGFVIFNNSRQLDKKIFKQYEISISPKDIC